jgi:hypothetical protein
MRTLGIKRNDVVAASIEDFEFQIFYQWKMELSIFIGTNNFTNEGTIPGNTRGVMTILLNSRPIFKYVSENQKARFGPKILSVDRYNNP